MRQFQFDGDRIVADGGMIAVCEWIEAHQLRPMRVPLHGRFWLDEQVDEWVFEMWALPIRIDPETNEVVMVRVRRRVVSFPRPEWLAGAE